jgi:HlyD family secretion protein
MALTDNIQAGFVAKHRWLVWTTGIVAAVVILASFVLTRGDVARVRAATVERGAIRSVVSTNGKVEPQQNFEAHAPVATTVKRVLVKEGDHVRRGQLLVELNDAEALSQLARALAEIKTAQVGQSAIESGGSREEVLTLQADVTKARSERDTAQRNLDALRRLQQKGAASAGEVKDAENQWQRADADVKLLEQKTNDRYSKQERARAEAQKEQAQAAYAAADDVLRQLSVRAPFDGEVYSLPVKPGFYVNTGDLLLQEADLSSVLVRAFVDEPDIGRLAPGQKIEITWDAVPGRSWQGTVSNVPSTVKLRGTRNVGETTCVVSNRDFKLLPNINVGVIIITAEHNGVLSVPREAVHLDDTKPYVYQIEDNELRRRPVQTSISNLTRVEISGLPENAQVAVSTVDSKPLREGLQVKVVR